MTPSLVSFKGERGEEERKREGRRGGLIERRKREKERQREEGRKRDKERETEGLTSVGIVKSDLSP